MRNPALILVILAIVASPAAVLAKSPALQIDEMRH